MRELRNSLTNTELAHYIAFFNMYPMGEEAMDSRFGMLLAKLESGLGVVQMKKGRTARVKELFKRDFWTRPRSVGELKNKLMVAFTALGMEKGDE